MSLRFRLFALACAVIVPSLGNPASAESPFSRLYVFGDSLSDTGNAFLATGGEAGAFPYYQGRFSNGPVWVEVLAEQLELDVPEASLLGGTNYAWAGAETGPGLSFFGTWNVGMQIDSFAADHGGFAGDELIVLAAAGNDLLWEPPYGAGHIVENLRNHILDLTDLGAKTILVANTPVAEHSGEKVKELLAQEIERLNEKLDATIISFDMLGLWQEIVMNAPDYGLTNVTDPACPGCGIGIPEPDAIDTLVPNPDEYFYWDLIHPTRVVHAIAGKAAAETVWLAVLLSE